MLFSIAGKCINPSDSDLPEKIKNPNIILIMADDMGYECLSSNGSLSYQTPVLDKVAENGIRFTHCFSQPICTPSRVKIMTGKYNSRNYLDFGILDINEFTFGNMLKEAGYQTVVAGKWQLNGRDGQEPGWQDKTRPGHFGFDEYCLWQLTEKGSRYAHPNIEQNGEVLETTIDDYGPDIVSNYILDFIQRNREKPFFVYYPMILVHNPFTPTPDSPEWKQPELRNKQNDKYFKDMVEYTDKIVGRIVSKLEELDISENTILIFTGDNGTNTRIITQTTAGDYKGGKGSMKDNGTHVPLVIQWPQSKKRGITTNTLIEFSDFLPTFAQAANIQLKTPVDGISFLDLFTSGSFAGRKSVFVHYYPRTRQVRSNNGCFIRTRDYKLYSDGHFYDMKKDNLEKHPLHLDSLNEIQRAEYIDLKKELDTKPIWNFNEIRRIN